MLSAKFDRTRGQYSASPRNALDWSRFRNADHGAQGFTIPAVRRTRQVGGLFVVGRLGLLTTRFKPGT